MPESADVAEKIDSLRKSGTWINVVPRCNWGSFMERACSSSDLLFEVSAILPMPFINMNPGNFSPVFTSLHQAAEQSSRNSWSTIMVTYDQPLFAKAMDVVLATPPD